MQRPRVRMTMRCVGLTSLVACSVLAATRPAEAVSPDDPPMTVAASCVGRFAKGRSWYLSVNSAGEAELTIATLPVPTRRKFVVPRQRLAELRAALEKERFFDLVADHGRRVPDGSTQTLVVTVGEQTKAVQLRFLMDEVNGDRARLRETARAVRIAMLIRGWFDDAGAVDLRRYQQVIVDATKE